MAHAPEQARARLAALRNAYHALLPGRVAALRGRWEQLRGEPDSAALLAEFRREVHSIAGSAGTFGYAEVTDAARTLEKILVPLMGERPLDPEEAATAVGAALTAIEGAAGQRVPSPVANADALLRSRRERATQVLLVGDDAYAEEMLSRYLRHLGLQLRVLRDGDAAAAAVREGTAAALLMDMNPGLTAAGGHVPPACVLEARKADTPVFFLSGDASWGARLAAARAGGSAFFTKPLDANALADRLAVFARDSMGDPYRILIVDDEDLLAQHFALVLREAGMIVRTTSDPAATLDLMSELKPDLIVMDLYMPGCLGTEVAAVIRQDDAYLQIPIVYLSTEAAREQQLAALRAGGDDFLEKPIRDEHLVQAVRIRVARARLLGEQMARDRLTGLANHVTLKMELDRELTRAAREAEPLAFAMLDIDHFKSVNDRYGHPMGDQVIRQLAQSLSRNLRKSDIIGRYGGEEFAIVMPRANRDAAAALLERLREAFAGIVFSHQGQEFHATFSAGLACSPPAAGRDELISRADEALYQAKRSGRDRVVFDDAG